jgi:aspartate aminotransferase
LQSPLRIQLIYSIKYAPIIERSAAMSLRLSQRIQRMRPSATVSITAKALKLREQGHDIIGLSAGEPDFDTPDYVKAAAIEAIRAGQTKYTPVDGTRVLKTAIADKLARENRLSYELDQILVTSGAKQACFNACQALLDPGDEAIVPAPYWVSYPDMVRLAGGEPVIVHTTSDSGFRMQPEELAAAITPHTKLLILNSPNNPTGAVYSLEELAAFGEVLRAHPRVVILSDDIYEHICWAPAPFTALANACPDLLPRILTVNGMSKAYAMSGWRVGYAAGAVELIKAMTALQSQSTTNACSISQAAATAALRGDQSYLATARDAFSRRHDFVHAALNDMPGIHCVPGQGAFYLFPEIGDALKLKSCRSDVEFCERLLDDAGVALVPGSAFGSPGHMRISFAAADDTLHEALARIRNFLAA